MNWKTLPFSFSLMIFLRKGKAPSQKRDGPELWAMWARQRLRPGCCLIQSPRPPGRQSAGCSKSCKQAPKLAPFPGCLVCAAHGAAQSSLTKDSTRIQGCCLSKQDRVREDTTALRDWCLTPATQRRETSLWIMSREHKGDGYWTVANLYKQMG